MKRTLTSRYIRIMYKPLTRTCLLGWKSHEEV